MKRTTALLYIITLFMYSTLCLGQNSSQNSKSYTDSSEYLSKPFNILDTNYTFISSETIDAFYNIFEFNLDSAHYSIIDSPSTIKKFDRSGLGAKEAVRIDLDQKYRPHHVHLQGFPVEIANLSSKTNYVNSLCIQTGKRGKINSIALGIDTTILQGFEISNSGQLIASTEYVLGQEKQTTFFYSNLFSRSKLKRISKYFHETSFDGMDAEENYDPFSYFNLDVYELVYDCLNAIGQSQDWELFFDDENTSSELREISHIVMWNDDGTGDMFSFDLSGKLEAFGKIDEEGNPFGGWTYLRPSGEIKKIKAYSNWPNL
jgi:hypothetical protein